MNELIQQMRALGGNCAKAADAIESLQLEIDCLKSYNGRLIEEGEHRLGLAGERNALQARINELEQGEPVAWAWRFHQEPWQVGIEAPWFADRSGYEKRKLVFSAKTQPLTDERGEFNKAINFAISLGLEASDFLRAWREGDASEWPEFANHGIGGQQL